jgi:hypothetical protein
LLLHLNCEETLVELIDEDQLQAGYLNCELKSDVVGRHLGEVAVASPWTLLPHLLLELLHLLLPHTAHHLLLVLQLFLQFVGEVLQLLLILSLLLLGCEPAALLDLLHLIQLPVILNLVSHTLFLLIHELQTIPSHDNQLRVWVVLLYLFHYFSLLIAHLRLALILVQSLPLHIQVYVFISHLLGDLVVIELGQGASLELIEVPYVLNELEHSYDLGLLHLKLDLYLIIILHLYLILSFQVLVLATQ